MITKATKRSPKRANVHGGSGEVERGTWCTPKWIAEIVGPYDLDPFSNPRSHIDAIHSCALERGENGLLDLSVRGSFLCTSAESSSYVATTKTKVWFQPPYSIVLQAFAHYRHTRFTALLRFDPSTEWFQQLYRSSELVCVPRLRRINFEPPPGVKSSSSTVPHALFYARLEDATPAVLRACIAWKTR